MKKPICIYVYICIHLHICMYVCICLYIYLHYYYFFVCSILKHQLNTDILGKSGTCISKAISVSSRK